MLWQVATTILIIWLEEEDLLFSLSMLRGTCN